MHSAGDGVVIIGGGPAGQAAAALLPHARLVARPAATAWHVEPGRLWVLCEGRVEALAYEALILAAPVPQIALALGCHMRGWQPEVDEHGRTSVAALWAAGAVIGARTAEEAVRQGQIVAQALRGDVPEGRIEATPLAPVEGDVVCECLGVTRAQIAASGLSDPAAIADLFSLRAGTCRMARCGPALGDAVRLYPAAPVPLAALAALTPGVPPPRPLQSDPMLEQKS